MSAEALRGEPTAENKRYEIKLGVAFKPFETARTFFWPKKGEEPFCIHEDYDYVLGLRREVSFRGIEGYLDLISENPLEDTMAMVVGGYPLEKPLGETAFRFTISEEGIGIDEAPYILRFSFFVRKPAEYAKLLNSFTDIKIGKEDYLLVWNLNRPFVKQNIHELEDGSEFVIVEKNMFNQKIVDDADEEVDMDKFENTNVGRVTFVWLPRKLKPLKTITMTFNQFGGNDEQEYLTEPPPPSPKLFAALAR